MIGSIGGDWVARFADEVIGEAEHIGAEVEAALPVHEPLDAALLDHHGLPVLA